MGELELDGLDSVGVRPVYRWMLAEAKEVELQTERAEILPVLKESAREGLRDDLE